MPIDMKLVIAGQFKELVRRGNVSIPGSVTPVSGVLETAIPEIRKP